MSNAQHSAACADLSGVRMERNAHGRLVLILADGTRHESVVPVRAFPIAAPLEGLSLVSVDGKEALWVDHMDHLPAQARTLIEEDLAVREFVPVIQRIHKVSGFSTPSTWTVSTDRGDTSFVLKAEEDIRRLEGGALLIASAHGVQFRIPDVKALDRASRKLLEGFL
jgi:hypothetical protein